MNKENNGNPESEELKDPYIKGYEQALKDTELTWEDISKIRDLLDIVRAVKGVTIDNQQLCTLVLERFNNYKKSKK